ncbi:MAG: terpene cyclase/mutase family protein [Planctomycetales bacterium]|nr:terpene cyclase/mutase family protein [Planctomycetales bacterium]
MMDHAIGRRAVALAIVAVILMGLPRSVSAYTPKDPKVKAVVAKAMGFLESYEGNSSWDQMMGVQMLVAYAAYEATKNRNHPLIAKAIQRAEEQMKQGSGQKEVYELGVAISFLTKFDEPARRQLAQRMYARLLEVQREDGSYGYEEGDGDTSVTQYALLGMWSARDSNLVQNFDSEPAERAANWLMRTQAPAGNWAYRGHDPGSFTRIKQDWKPSLSMHVAGAGSLYIAADLVGLSKTQEADDGSPFIKASQAQQRPVGKVINQAYLWDSLAKADQFWSANAKLNAPWQYYYMYGQERYMSFRSQVLGQKEPANGPDWYNRGVDLLESTQADNGSFKAQESNHPVSVDTALAVLFLLRSTKEKIHPATHGTQRGGPGIPDDFVNAVMTEDGEVVAPTKSNQVEDLATLIRMMETKSFDEIDPSKYLERPNKKKSELDLLREMIKDDDFNKRMLAVTTLSQGGMANAPVMIYALSDPDNRVMRVARDNLRLTSRKLGGFGLPDEATKEQKEIAQRKWSAWLQSVRPDLEF